METSLHGRTVLITGGSGAIGQALALAFGHEGANVAITYHRNRQAASDVVKLLEAAGVAAIALPYRQAEPGKATELIDRVNDHVGPVTAVVANAVQWPSHDKGEVADLAESMRANVVGTVAAIDAALPTIRDDGSGRIVLVSTDIVDQPMPGPVGYPAAKGALESVGRVLAVREASHGILTNVVRPGFTLTERARRNPWLGQSAIDGEAARTPTGRICTPEDVANVAVYLGSAANTHVNGQTISVAGGRELTR